MRRIFLLAVAIVLITMSPVMSLAHSGGTDENGGHYDDDTGEYHYHHGYPAHDHPENICPYSMAETSFNSSCPWDYEFFLNEYVYGFQFGYDIGHSDGEDDGYEEYYHNSKIFNDETEYDDTDYDEDSPFVYGYCDGYRCGYDVAFVETYNDEAIYNESEHLYDESTWFEEEIKPYHTYKTTSSPSQNTASKEYEERWEKWDTFEIICTVFTVIASLSVLAFTVYYFVRMF